MSGRDRNAIQLRSDDYDVKKAKTSEEIEESGAVEYEKYDEFSEVHLYRKLGFLVEQSFKPRSSATN
jgi:hypothetical protein